MLVCVLLLCFGWLVVLMFVWCLFVFLLSFLVVSCYRLSFTSFCFVSGALCLVFVFGFVSVFVFFPLLPVLFFVYECVLEHKFIKINFVRYIVI